MILSNKLLPLKKVLINRLRFYKRDSNSLLILL